MMALPEDVISEIFLRLPAKSIFKLKSCCKSISNITNNKYFALKQAQNMMLKDDSALFIQGIKFFPEYKQETEICKLSRREPYSSSGIPSKFLQFLHERSISILASSNGLLLLLSEKPNEVLFICNPATQSYSIIATPEKHYELLEFAFIWNHNNEDGDAEEFQLIHFHQDTRQGATREYVCQVYMPEEGVWKEREKRLSMNDDESWIHGSHVFYKGNIYFASFSDYSNYHYMATYNFDSGVTRRFIFPYELFIWDYIRIFKWGQVGTSNESICVVSLHRNSVFTIWVLTELELPSWSKVLSLSLEEMGLEEDDSVVDFAIMNGHSIVFVTNWNDVYKYDLIEARDKRLEKIGVQRTNGGYLSFIPYSNTLRSCGAGAKDFTYEI